MIALIPCLELVYRVIVYDANYLNSLRHTILEKIIMHIDTLPK
jgi:hypothetical protein